MAIQLAWKQRLNVEIRRIKDAVMEKTGQNYWERQHLPQTWWKNTKKKKQITDCTRIKF